MKSFLGFFIAGDLFERYLGRLEAFFSWSLERKSFSSSSDIESKSISESSIKGILVLAPHGADVVGVDLEVEVHVAIAEEHDPHDEREVGVGSRRPVTGRRGSIF